MKKNVRWFLMLFLSVLMLACDNTVEDPSNTDDDTPPGEEYTQEGKYRVNVVYFIPSDLDTLPRWHKRLSEVTLYMQEFYRQNMKRYGFEKTFNLEVNKVNPKYIRMYCVRSEKSTQELDSLHHISQEVRAYFKKNPTELASNHFLIYTPQYKKAAVITGSAIEKMEEASDIFDSGVCVFGYDTENFDTRHLVSDRARKRFLPYLGYLLQDLGGSFFLQRGCEKATDPFYSIMGYQLQRFIGTTGNNGIVGNPDNFRLLASDAVSLSELQVFNKLDRVYYQEKPRVTVEKLEMTYNWTDTITFTCEYKTTDQVVGVIVYHDIWRSIKKEGAITSRDEETDKAANTHTSEDAMPYLVEEAFIAKEGDTYKVSIDIPRSDMPIGWISGPPARPYDIPLGAEFRVRFIMKDGVFVPHTGDPDIKGEASMRRSYRIINDMTVYPPLRYPDFSVPNEIK